MDTRKTRQQRVQRHEERVAAIYGALMAADSAFHDLLAADCKEAGINPTDHPLWPISALLEDAQARAMDRIEQLREMEYE